MPSQEKAKGQNFNQIRPMMPPPSLPSPRAIQPYTPPIILQQILGQDNPS